MGGNELGFNYPVVPACSVVHLAGLCWQCGVFSRVVLVGKALPLLFSVVGWGSVGGGDAVMQIWCITVNG